MMDDGWMMDGWEGGWMDVWMGGGCLFARYTQRVPIRAEYPYGPGMDQERRGTSDERRATSDE